MDALGHCLRASTFNCRQAIGEHRADNRHHLTIAVVGIGELATRDRGADIPFKGRTGFGRG
jgi:hypothetical protein